MTNSEYIVGLDLGQVSEFTALAVVEKQGWSDESIFFVRHLRRYEPGTSYLKILADVAGMIESGPLQATFPTVIIDGTSAGTAVVQMFRSRLWELGTQVIAALISAGDMSAEDADWTRIPKRDLVSCVQVLLQTSRLKIAQAMPEAKTLTRELENFRAEAVTSSTDAMVAWREGMNDDLVLALALPVWMGMQRDAGAQEFLIAGDRNRLPGSW